MSALLAIVGHVERDSPLPLRLVQDLIHCVQQSHFVVHVSDLFFSKLKKNNEEISITGACNTI